MNAQPEIRIETEASDDLMQAIGRLLPQLAPQLEGPSRETLERIVGGPCSALFTARFGERIAGMLTLAWYDAPSGRKAWVEDVAVDAGLRGRGAGEMLLRAALAHARRIGAGRVMLTSAPHRTAARALYRKMGFSEAETAVFVRKME